MKTKSKNILLIIGFLYILLSLAYFLGVSYTGYVVFEESYMVIDFSNESEYMYDNITITFDQSIKLIPTINITTITEETLENSYVILALRDQHDVTDKIIALDNSTVIIEKEQNPNIFNVYFDKNLTNNDILRLFVYTVGDTTTDEVFLCNINETCEEPGYGEIDIDEDGWYNLTIINLNQTTNSFNIDPEKIKFDYIDALHKELNIYNITDITYPLIGIVETQNIFINGSLGNIVINHTLNNQTVNYYYSTDEGENYNLIETNLSQINNTVIKFRIELVSDTTNTPIVYDLKIDYMPNPTKTIEQPPTSGGSSGGGGGSSGSSKKTIQETPTQTEEVITSLEELPKAENILEPKIIKKSEIENNVLTELTGKATYSRTNIIKFLKSNLWILIFLIALIIIYLILHIERHKIHKTYKSKKK